MRWKLINLLPLNSQQTNDVQFVFISSSVIKFSACILKPEGKGIRCTLPCIPLCPVFFLPIDQNLKIFRGSMVHDMLIGLSTVEQLSSNKTVNQRSFNLLIHWVTILSCIISVISPRFFFQESGCESSGRRFLLLLVARISRLTSHIALKKLFCRLIDIRFQKVLLDPLTQTVVSNDFLLKISPLNHT